MKKNLYSVPENKKIRVIIDTDAFAEADDQFAIIHALLTPKFDVVGIIATHFGKDDSMINSYHEINRILELTQMSDKVKVFKGSTCALEDEFTPQCSEGSQFIINEAMRDSEQPLFVLNIGAITNLASAYLANHSIKDRLLAVWIGGGKYPVGHIDFNLANDIHAANAVFSSDIELWQIPINAYTQMEVSFHELYYRIYHCGDVGKYLFTNLMRVNEHECSLGFDALPFFKNSSKAAKTMIIRSGEGWSLGDNPAIGVLITPQMNGIEERQAQRINPDGTYGDYIATHRRIRVYNNIDSRVILEDFFSKLNYHFG